MANSTHYDTLEVTRTATQAEIKRSYRRLARLFHPDGNQATADHDRIARVNAAYEVLGNPGRRRSYDQQLHLGAPANTPSPFQRQQWDAAVKGHRERRQTGQTADEQMEQWLKRVYTPINRKFSQILNPLQAEIDDLAADPFDDELMADFQSYLEDCRSDLSQAQAMFRSMPNPPSVAGVAAHLYYCLNQIGDGIEELNLFTLNYDEHYLHTGLELFRIAEGLQQEAQAAVKSIS